MDSPCSSTSHVDEPSSSSKTLSSAADVQAERMKKVTLKSPEDEGELIFYLFYCFRKQT